MRPESIGRVLGIGLRVAGRVAGQRIMGNGQPAPSPSVASGASASARPSSPDPSAQGRAAGQTTRGVARGIRGFLQPFREVGGKIWLEVSGVFFLLPVLVFTPTLWRTRFSWSQGPDHRTFWSSAVVVLVFLYLGITSFWRARKR